MLVLNGGDRLIIFPFFRFHWQPEMPPDAGHGKRESAPATISVRHVFPVLKPSCPAFANRSNGRQDRFQTNAAGGTPTTASHARMTMTVAGLPSRRQERGTSPLSVAPPFRFPCGALRHPTHFLLFPSRLSKLSLRYPSVIPPLSPLFYIGEMRDLCNLSKGFVEKIWLFVNNLVYLPKLI